MTPIAATSLVIVVSGIGIGIAAGVASFAKRHGIREVSH